MYLFDPIIDGWKSWGRIFQSAGAFRPLLFPLFHQAGLDPPDSLLPLTPGTNGVFRAGEYVVKIYAPSSSGLDTRRDFLVECAWLQAAQEAGVRAPRLIYAGEFSDRYLFRFLIMERVPGRDARDVIFSYTPQQRVSFVGQVRDQLQKLHRISLPISPVDLVGRSMENVRWNALHPHLVEELLDHAGRQDLSDGVWCHGDLTGENVLIRDDGLVAVIDFADAVFAPAWYDYPPLVFELFGAHREFLSLFLDGDDPGRFVDELMCGLCLHDFSGEILRSWLERMGVPPERIAGMDQLRSLLLQTLF